MALQSSQRLPELQFYMKKSYRILQLQFYKGTHTHTSYIRYKEFSIQNPILHAEDKELFKYYYYYYVQRARRPSFQKRNSMHRRQGDLLEIHPCVFQDFPKTFQAFQSLQTFQTFQSFMTIQPFQVILQVPVSPGNPSHSSILQLECIFYIFYSSIGFHRKLHRVPIEQIQTFYKHYILQRKGDVVISVKTCKTCIGQDVKMTYSPE